MVKRLRKMIRINGELSFECFEGKGKFGNNDHHDKRYYENYEQISKEEILLNEEMLREVREMKLIDKMKNVEIKICISTTLWMVLILMLICL